MARRSSVRPSARPTTRAPVPAQQPSRNAPAPVAAPAPAPAPVAAPAPSMGGGLLSTIAQGLMFGTGSAIAHRAVDAVAGPRQVEHVHVNQDAPAAAPVAAAPVANTMGNSVDNDTRCAYEKADFQRCMQSNNSNLDSCNPFFEALSTCRKAYF